MAPQRILCNRPASVKITLTDQDGSPREASSSAAVSLERLDESTFAPVDVTVDGEGRLDISLALSDLPSPDELTVTATDPGGIQTETVQVVGGFYFSPYEARIADDNLQDMELYTDEDVIRVRPQVEDECERICRQAFVPRAERIWLSGDGSGELFANGPVYAVRSASVGGVPLTPDELASLYADPSTGVIYRSSGAFRCGSRNVSLVVEYGWPRPPADLQEATIRRLRERLNSQSSRVPSRATAQIADGGSFTLATPGRGGFETGNPDVDAVYSRYSWGPSIG